MIDLSTQMQPEDLKDKLTRLWQVSGPKILSIEQTCPPGTASPVFTINGRYTAKGWTEWTQGFQFGAAAMQFDATGDEQFLELAQSRTRQIMAPHITHVGVHDHGFNNVSTYGNLWRLAKEGKAASTQADLDFYELALKCSGAVQASRWTQTNLGKGFIYSFNGPHSLFVDTIRSLRALAVAHKLGHVLMGEKDAKISLLGRLIEHTELTARFSIYYGEGRDSYDVRGRTAHESIFNINDGSYRCPNSQQGYSPFSTWTRGLAWAICGYPELLEFLQTVSDEELQPFGGRPEVESMMLRAARATCDFYIEQTPTCGVPYWDTGAPGLSQMGDYLNRPADPFNDYEPVDSSAAAIAAQGLLRLGRYLQPSDSDASNRYWQAGLKVLDTLLTEPYLSTSPDHQGLLLHAVYHRPNGWDNIPEGQVVPCNESCMWGDYHLLEAGLYVQRLINKEPYLTFFGQ